MARPGVTYHDVARAAAKLVEQKRRPSIEAVRNVLGTGSNSTINRHLREWSKTQGLQTELKEGLPDSLLIAIRGIYDAMREQSNEKLNLLKKESDAIISRLQSSIKSLEVDNAKLAQEKISLERKVRQQFEETAAIRRAMDQLNKNSEAQLSENNLLNNRLCDKQSELKRLTKLLEHTQANLEHYRETQLQERVADKNSFENKISVLENTNKLQQGVLSDLREERACLKQQLQSMAADKIVKTNARKKILSAKQRQENELQALKFDFVQLQKTHDQLLSKHDVLSKKSDTDRIKINELVIKDETNSSRIAMLESTLQKTEDSLRCLGDKHLFLMQEKTELACQLNKTLGIKQFSRND